MRSVPVLVVCLQACVLRLCAPIAVCASSVVCAEVSQLLSTAVSSGCQEEELRDESQ
jgi:hypothetical protein